jgi:mannose-6-phosphate isomerase-like protein (cupin superfamily)
MLIKILDECEEIVAGDGSILRELLHPARDPAELGYSLAHAKVEPGKETLDHRLKGSEVYYILNGEGVMHIDGEQEAVSAGSTVYIPAGAVQKIRNTGDTDLAFLCIVQPAWKPEDEEVLEG